MLFDAKCVKDLNRKRSVKNMKIFDIFKNKFNLTKIYSNNTIIIPEKYMKEYNNIVDDDVVKKAFLDYTLIQKESYINLKTPNGLCNQSKEIPIIEANKNTLCGIIIEKEFSLFFTEVYATVPSPKDFNKIPLDDFNRLSNEPLDNCERTNLKRRAGLFIGSFTDKNIINLYNDDKSITITLNGGGSIGSGFVYYNFKIGSISIESNNDKIKRYLSKISLILDILGQSYISEPGRQDIVLPSPNNFKGKAYYEISDENK